MWRCMRDQGWHLSFARWLSNSRLLGHPNTASHISMVSQCWFSQSVNLLEDLKFSLRALTFLFEKRASE